MAACAGHTIFEPVAPIRQWGAPERRVEEVRRGARFDEVHAATVGELPGFGLHRYLAGIHPRRGKSPPEIELRGPEPPAHQRPSSARSWTRSTPIRTPRCWCVTGTGSTTCVHGNLGLEVQGGSVNDDVGRRMWVSGQLLLIGTIIGGLVGVAIGAWSAVRQYKFVDNFFTVSSFVLLSIPTFVLAILLQLLAVKANKWIGHRVFQYSGQFDPGAERWHARTDHQPARSPDIADDRARADRRRLPVALSAQRDARRAGQRLRADRAGQGPAATHRA